MSLIYQSGDMLNGRRPGLYLGGKTDAKDSEKLQRWQVSHVLNMTPAKDSSIQAGVPNYFESSSSKLRLQYLRIPVYDASTSASDILQKADEIVSFIAKGLLHGSVLVHCQRGVSRSATAVCMYLMRRAGMCLEDALALVKRRRPKANPLPAFLEILKEYEGTCRSLGVIKGKNKTKRVSGPVGPPSKRPKAADAPTRPIIVGPSNRPSDPLKGTEEKTDKSKGCL